MSLPSDVTPDVSEAMAQDRPAVSTAPRPRGLEQGGVIVAALVAFFGIAYLGPALTRLTRKPTLQDRMARRVQEARRQAEQAGGKVRKRVRQLGGGTIRR